MATETQIKKWTFETAGNYTLTGDTTVASGNLSMTDPVVQLPWATAWSAVPGDDGNGDAVLANGTTYTHRATLLSDGVFVFWAKRTTMATGKKLAARVRIDGAHWIAAQMVDGTGAQILRDGDGAVGASSAEWEADWPEDGTWREHKVKFIGVTVRFSIDSPRHIEDGASDYVFIGDLALLQDDPNNPVTVGGGGVKAQPYMAHRRYGACELKAANAWTIPYGTESLGELSYVADLLGGGTEQLTVALQYKIDSGSWTDCPATGDISGESFTAGTSTMLFRLNDGAGYGLDNQNDPEYVPTVLSVLITYETTSASGSEGGYLKDVLTNIKAALNADGTLMGYEGWSGAQVGWADVMNLQLYHRCGVIVEWKDTTETHRASKRSAGALVNAIDETHTVTVKACMRLDRDLEDMLIADDQLLDFAEHVAQVLRSETLSDTVHSVTVGEKRPSTEYFESSEGEDEPGDILLIKEIDVEVHGKPFEAVRP